ncbi:MAG: hypothetical protein AAF740_09165 [Bacteroidota bacterium]
MDDSTTQNSSAVEGNDNIILQGINHSEVNVTINKIAFSDLLPPQVNEQKATLKTDLTELATRIENLADDPLPSPEEDFSDTIEELLPFIEEESCVLFLGPELALNQAGQSLHDSYFEQLGDGDKVEFNASSGLFERIESPSFKIKVRKYYRNAFWDRNQIGRKAIRALLTAPFTLVVNMAPDDTARKVLELYDRDKSFLAYKGTSFQDAKPTRSRPVVLNLLGDASENGRNFTFTKKDIYDYLKTAKLPANIKETIQDAAQLLFVGFDFRRWYAQLLLYINLTAIS